MATLVLKDAVVTIDGTTLSDHANEVTLEYSADEVEDTNFGDDTHQFMGGSLKNWSLSVTFAQDYASSSVDDTLFDLVGASAVTVSVKPTSDATSATNPEFSGSAVLLSYNPLAGSVGERLSAEVSFSPAGDLSRSTS